MSQFIACSGEVSFGCFGVHAVLSKFVMQLGGHFTGIIGALAIARACIGRLRQARCLLIGQFITSFQLLSLKVYLQLFGQGSTHSVACQLAVQRCQQLTFSDAITFFNLDLGHDSLTGDTQLEQATFNIDAAAGNRYISR